MPQCIACNVSGRARVPLGKGMCALQDLVTSESLNKILNIT